MSDKPPVMLTSQQVWRHRKRGTDYRVVSVAWGQGGTIEEQSVVVYEAIADHGEYYARRLDEFRDRFELVADSKPIAPPCAHCEGADYGCPTHSCEVCGKSSAARPHSAGCPMRDGAP